MRVVVMPPFASEFFGGATGFDLDAGNVFALVRALDAHGPGFADIAEARAAFAVDGVFAPDWTQPLASAREVIVLQRVAGGDRTGCRV